MSEKTNIAWADSTINFWRGCDKVSDGCKNCYIVTTTPFRASGMKHGDPRVKGLGAVKDALAFNRKPWICDDCGGAASNDFQYKGKGKCPNCGGYVTYHRRRIFSLSLGDWLDDQVPIEWLAEMLDTIRQCSDVTWILCTKRPENFHSRLTAALEFGMQSEDWLEEWMDGMAPSNIILLTSVENQAMADLRIPQLLKIPAACRGLSLEPLLGPVDLTKPGIRWLTCPPSRINWLIIGGESGPNARPCNVDWIRSLVAQGKAAGVATFVKQLGGNAVITPQGYDPISGHTFKPMPMFGFKDKKGGNPVEWPEDLRVQQFPKGIQ